MMASSSLTGDGGQHQKRNNNENKGLCLKTARSSNTVSRVGKGWIPQQWIISAAVDRVTARIVDEGVERL